MKGRSSRVSLVLVWAATLSSTDVYGSGLKTVFEATAPVSRLTVVASETFTPPTSRDLTADDVSRQLRAMRRSSARFMLLFCGTQHAGPVLEGALEATKPRLNTPLSRGVLAAHCPTAALYSLHTAFAPHAHSACVCAAQRRMGWVSLAMAMYGSALTRSSTRK